MGFLFLFIVLVDDLNNVSQFITMSFCLSDRNYFKKLYFQIIFFGLTVELRVYFNLIKIN